MGHWVPDEDGNTHLHWCDTMATDGLRWTASICGDKGVQARVYGHDVTCTGQMQTLTGGPTDEAWIECHDARPVYVDTVRITWPRKTVEPQRAHAAPVAAEKPT